MNLRSLQTLAWGTVAAAIVGALALAAAEPDPPDRARLATGTTPLPPLPQEATSAGPLPPAAASAAQSGRAPPAD